LGIGWLAFKVSDYSTKWLILFLLIGGVSIPLFFAGIANLISVSILLICPHKKTGGIFMGIGAIIICIGDMIGYFNYPVTLFIKVVIYSYTLLIWVSFVLMGLRIGKSNN